MKLSLSFPGLLGILFIGLKLSDKIDWSWWWVLSPFWIPTAVAIVIGIIYVVLKALFDSAWH